MWVSQSHIKLSKKNIIEGRSELFEPYKTQLSSFVCFSFSFILKFNLDLCGVANYRVTGEYLVWNNATASLCRNNLVCPASDQVSISKSGFQIASPPLFFFFFFVFFPSSCFEDEAFCVSTGYSNLWCPFSPVCRGKRKETILSWPIRIKQFGTGGWQHVLLSVILLVGWLLWGSSFYP